MRGAIFSRVIIPTLLIAGPAVGQVQTKNHANWKLSDRFSTELVSKFIGSTTVTPRFINNTDRFWYNWRDRSGTRFMIVDPKAKSKTLLFDSAKMAALLSEQLKKPYDSQTLPITTIDFSTDGKKITFTVEETRFEYDLDAKTLKNLGKSTARPGVRPPAAGIGGGRGTRGGAQGGPGRVAPTDFRAIAPDKKFYVYAKDHNLFLVEGDDATKAVQITNDGEQYFSFGSRPTGNQPDQSFDEEEDGVQTDDIFGSDYDADPQRRGQGGQQGGQGTRTQTTTTQGGQARPTESRVRPQVTWSKDSRYFYVTRSDSRKVGELWLVDNYAEPRPKLQTYKYTMPGETNVTQFEFQLFDRTTKKLKKVDLLKYKDGQMMNISWTESGKIRFERRDRLQRNLQYCEYDPETDKTKVLVTESTEIGFLERQDFRPIEAGKDMLWWSERSGWGHLYRYDFNGKLIGQLTSGPWRVDSVVDLDGKKNTVWFRGAGKEDNENPYNAHLYKLDLETKAISLLDAGDSEHSSALSPSKDFIVDSYSRVDMPGKSVLRDGNGRVVMDLEKVDTKPLEELGWKMPERFSVKAADNVTDLYGNMWKPFDFDPKKKYPIILNVYPGPQTESVTQTFSVMPMTQRLANLGFIVIQLGNRGGNPKRSNAYHSFGYFNLRDYALEDKKVGVEQLAAKNLWIDIDKVGIFGHSGGGFMSSAALLVPPYNDFFKVAVSSSGNHDNNIYNQNWSEQHHGIKEIKSYLYGDKFEIKVPTNVEVAGNLKGKLLLVHGDMDNNVHPANTSRLVNALIKAGKRFDYMIMPGQQHGYGPLQPYFTQLLMEYFSEHLMGDNYRQSAELKVKG